MLDEFYMQARGDFETGRILHLKSEIRKVPIGRGANQAVQSAISDLGFEVQDSSNLEISLFGGFVKYVGAQFR